MQTFGTFGLQAEGEVRIASADGLSGMRGS